MTHRRKHTPVLERSLQCGRKGVVSDMAWIMNKLCLKTSSAKKQNSLPLPFVMDGRRKTI
jgi:hypothetical protein